jgi:hypothetical protein
VELLVILDIVVEKFEDQPVFLPQTVENVPVFHILTV